MSDRLSQIMAFEAGELNEIDSIKLFQDLIDDGTAWKLQGSYGRTAAALIRNGTCRPAKSTPPEIAADFPAEDWIP